MAIVKMKKLRLLAVRPQKDEIIKELMLLGCVQVSELNAETASEEIGVELEREAAGLMGFRSDQTIFNTALRLLDKYTPCKTKLLSPKPEVELSVIMDENALADELAEAERLVRLDERIRRIEAEESRERGAIESLTPWKGLELPLETAETGTCVIMHGTFPSSVKTEEAGAHLSEACPESALFVVNSDPAQHYCTVVCMTAEQQDALSALRDFGFSLASFQGMAGTVQNNIDAGENRLKKLSEEKAGLSARIASGGARRESFRLCIDRMSAKLAGAEAAERLLHTGSSFALEGWMPAEKEEALCSLLEGYDCAWELEDPKPEEYPDVPVHLKNNRFTRPLNMVTNMYSLPAYDGIDPNPLMAPFFLLFYGIMMADMGYGLLMIIAGITVLKKARPKGGMRTFFELMLECGTATFIMGFITGGFFGNAVPTVIRIFNPESTWDFWSLFNPLNDTVYVLIGAMILGSIQILTGMTINIVMQARDGHLLDGILDIVPWWLLFAGFGVAALTGSWVLVILGVVAIVCTQGRSKKSILGKLFSGLGALYNITGYLGDVLSYSRLMALMLAGGVIAQVFNTLAALPKNIVFFAVFFLIGQVLNFALNLLGCYVHDLRLQCLEYFGKFYKDGGKPFKPLCINTKFVEVVKEEN